MTFPIHNLLSLMIFMLFNIFISNCLDTNGNYTVYTDQIQHSYPTSITLLNNNILMIYNDGIFLYNSELKEETVKVNTNFTKDEILNSEMEQFSLSDDGYILITIKGNLYIFDKNADNYNNFEFNFTASYYTIIPHKKSGNDLYYFIAGPSSSKLYIYYYKFSIDKIEVINQIELDIGKIYSTYSIAGLSCLFMIPNNQNEQVLTCFFSFTVNDANYLHASSFKVADLTEISDLHSSMIIKQPCTIIRAKSDENKSKSLMLCKSQSIEWIVFDFNIKNFTEPIKFDAACSEFSRLKNRFYYFEQTGEYAYICQENACTFYFCNFGKDLQMTFQQGYNVANCYLANSVSLIYSNYLKQYVVLTEKQVNSIWTTFAALLNDVESKQINTTNKESEDTEESEKEEEENQKSDEEDEKCPEKCELCNENSISKNKCLSCNQNNNYFPVDFGKGIKDSENFMECYSENTKPENFYFDKIEKVFKLCFETCKTCIYGGTHSENNCTSCDNDLIFKPRKNFSDCVAKCPFYYYYNLYDQYKCTNNSICPDEAKLLIKKYSECTNNCNIEEYKYKYSGECLEKCPENTTADKNLVCKDNDINKCSLSEFNLNIENENLINEVINLQVKNYAKDFSYTDKHVSVYNCENYKILIFKKDSGCLDELGLDASKIYCGECYEKLKKANSITDELIIVLLENLKTTKTSFSLFNPKTYKKLSTNSICEDNEISIYANIFSLLNNSDLDINTIKNLTDQEIDIFNSSSKFYTDLCYHFESPNGKDVTLNDRILIFFPNITLCDEGCLYKGINFTTMECKCQCKFNDIMNTNIFGDNAIINSMTNDYLELINGNNIVVLKCIKDVFNMEYMIKCTGAIIMSIIITFGLFFIFIFFALESGKVSEYLYYLSEYYIFYVKYGAKNLEIKMAKDNKHKKDNKGKKKDKNSSEHKKSKHNDNIHNIHAPPKNKKIKIALHQLSGRESEQISQSNEGNITTYEKKKLIAKKRKKNLDISPVVLNIGKKKEIKNNNTIINIYPNVRTLDNSNSEKTKNEASLKNLVLTKDMKKKIKKICGHVNFKEYLATKFDEMEFEDVLKNDKRNFEEFYISRLKDNQTFFDTFFTKHHIKPLSIKILLFLLSLNIQLVINGLFFSEDYISERYHDTSEEHYFSFMKRIFNRMVYTVMGNSIIISFFKCIFIEERKVKLLFLREKDNPMELKFEISKLINAIKKRFKIFIVIVVFLFVFAFFYISCFNIVYPYTKKEWIKSSVVILIIVQALPAITALIEGGLRYASFKCKSEKIFNFSMLLS